MYVTEIFVLAHNLDEGVPVFEMAGSASGRLDPVCTQDMSPRADVRTIVRKRSFTSECLICQDVMDGCTTRLSCCGVTMHTSCFSGLVPPDVLGATAVITCPNCRAIIDKSALFTLGFVVSVPQLLGIHDRCTAIRKLFTRAFSDRSQFATLYRKTQGIRQTDGLVYNACLFPIDRACLDHQKMAVMFTTKKYKPKRISDSLRGHIDFLIKCARVL
jgi:hypothetical protein